MPFYRNLFAPFVIFASLSAENIDEAIKYFNSFQFDKAQAIFERLSKDETNPRISEVYYYLARLCVNPDSALIFYQKITTNFPRSRYADISYLEIAKIKIAVREYEYSIHTLNQLLKNYPETDLKDEVLFWLGISHIESGKKREGDEILKDLIKNYPKSIWANRASNIIPDTVPQEVYYTIQIGSYRNIKNAEKRVEELKNNGFDARVVETVIKDNTFYRVWIGEFQTIDEAKLLLNRLESLGIKGNVVRGY